MTRATYRKRIRELRVEMRYQQERNRLDVSCLKGGRRKVKELGRQMCEVQKEFRGQQK